MQMLPRALCGLTARNIAELYHPQQRLYPDWDHGVKKGYIDADANYANPSSNTSARAAASTAVSTVRNFIFCPLPLIFIRLTDSQQETNTHAVHECHCLPRASHSPVFTTQDGAHGIVVGRRKKSFQSD